MSSDLAIRVKGLGKTYRVFSRPQDRLKQMFLGHWRKYYHEFWALQDVDLEVRRGEVVGIVGRNGSGKSTLLQMICGIFAPTAGTLEVHGRVAALLELGAGFNADFSGRDNVFLNGSILGLDRGEMEARFDAIAAFADIGEFIDQPVKTYSSGMYSRLAFAVAINVDPEIMVIDEALSVGDEAFQRKCFARLREIRDQGATVLFVSHSPGSVIQLCDRAILLDHGHRLLSASPKTVIAKYQKLAYAPQEKIAAIREEIRALDAAGGVLNLKVNGFESVGPPGTSNGRITAADSGDQFDPNMTPRSTVSYASRGAVISDPVITTVLGRRINVLLPGETYRYSYTVTFEQPGFHVRFGMMIKNVVGVELAGCSSHPEGEATESIQAGQKLVVSFEFQNLLAPGSYFLNAGVLGRTDDGDTWLHRVLDAAMFRVESSPTAVATGMVNLMTPTYCLVREVKTPSKV
jgi:lipopolysaccharide transport system ATP-binding protein